MIEGVGGFTYQATGTSSSTGTVTLTFPAVPQGLAWTGTIAFVVGTPITPNAPVRAFQAVWTVYVNQRPIIVSQGLQVISNVQVDTLETLTIQGVGLVPLTTVLATFTGYSVNTGSRVPQMPIVSGNPGASYLLASYTEQAVSGTFGASSSSVETAILFGPAVSSPVVTVQPGQQCYLVGYTISITLSTTSSATGVDALTASLILSENGTTTINIYDAVTVELSGINGGSSAVVSNQLSYPLYLGELGNVVGGNSFSLLVQLSEISASTSGFHGACTATGVVALL
jgi:hypothetical protein